MQKNYGKNALQNGINSHFQFSHFKAQNGQY